VAGRAFSSWRVRMAAYTTPWALYAMTPSSQDQAENVPGVILGEARYRNFVKSYNPDALVVGGEWPWPYRICSHGGCGPGFPLIMLTVRLPRRIRHKQARATPC
jgi:hypothetical protein